MTSLCTLDEVKAIAGLTGDGDDGLLADYIERASAALEEHLERELAPRDAEVRTFEVLADGPRGALVTLAPYELRSITSITIYPEDATSSRVLDATEYRCLPVGGALGSTRAVPTWTELRLGFRPAPSALGAALVEIDGDWGLGTTPPVIRDACARLVAGWVNKAVEQYNLDTDGDPRQTRPDQTRAGVPGAIRRLVHPYRHRSVG